MPTSAAASAGASLIPSPVTATISPPPLQQPDDPPFVRGRGPGHDGVTGQPGGQFLVGQAIERLAALQHRAAAEPGLARDGGGGGGLIAGDHDDRHAGSRSRGLALPDTFAASSRRSAAGHHRGLAGQGARSRRAVA
jgi:hypothetical protein